MSSRGLASLLVIPSALRSTLLQASTTTSLSQSRSLTRKATKSSPKTTPRNGAKTGSSSSKTRSRTASKPASGGRPNPAKKTAPRAAAKPASRTTSRTSPKTTSKSAPKPTTTNSKKSPTKPPTKRVPVPIQVPESRDTSRKPPSALSFGPTPNYLPDADNTLDKSAAISVITDSRSTDLPKARTLFGCGKFLHSSPRFLNLPYNSHIPEVCLLGRSNVGKSTLINALAGLGGKEAGTAHGPQAARAGVAITSSRAGCTTMMNAYGFGPPLKVKPQSKREQNAKKQSGRSRSERRQSEGVIKEPPPRHSIILMDVPGYGFNSETLWGDEILKYLEKREILRGAVLLIDAFAGIKPADRTIMKVLRDIGVNTSIVLTKADGLVRRPDYAAWAKSEPLKEAALHVIEEMRKIERHGDPQTAWSEGIEWNPEIFITGAGDPRMGGMGVDGARLAIAQMAGHIQRIEPVVDAEADESSEIVPYDQLVWGPSSTVPSNIAPDTGAVKHNEQLFVGIDAATTNLRSAESAGQSSSNSPRVIEPKRTQGRVRRGRRRQAAVEKVDPADPMASLMSNISRRRSKRQLGEASF